ncbi:CDC42 rho GTPase-activating protein [Crucibulum laeve]|uniref:CDC42 rho GTPase-activating protein n=1 Tax=Crucibulum laeve TaxID=68775 RepID=A0A5C3LPP4_9AGAR|nr:CDC42 rho GTPase-activating protein [Crucibulum laeve]
MPPNPLNLKQRLTALSLAPSSPSSPHGTPLSPSGMKRKFFNPPWTKRQQEPTSNIEYGEVEMVQEVMGRMIFQAGVDFETRPMVVVNASALPDPQGVSYDLLLSRILAYLNLYVESDYTVVFFAAGGRHTPGWNWVWKAYRSLSRKYRKNLKQLYIVHSSFFSKMLFSLAGAIISPKFFRKLVYISTLSELAEHIPLTQIDIPPAVYQENLKYESKITLPVPMRSSIFGVPLEDLMGYEGEKGGVPRVVRDAIQFLRESGMEEEGLFRRSPHSAMLRAAQEAYDRGNVVSLNTFGDLHLAAVLLKKYLRDLPKPIFSENMYPVIRRCPAPTSDPNDMAGVVYIRETLLPELAPCAYILLSHVLHLMHEVSLRAASNRMDAHNLAVVLCPNLVKGTNPARDVMMCAVPGGPALFQPQSSPFGTPPPSSSSPQVEGRTTLGLIIKLCIQRYYEIFDEVWDRTEAVPQQDGAVSSESSSLSGGQRRASVVRSDDDSEDIDDTMLVMPIGPSHRSNNSIQHGISGGRPPSAWGGAAGASTPGGGSGVRSVHTVFGENTSVKGGVPGFSYPTMGKAKSMISIEKGSGTTHGRKGSISVGRGTTRKSTGAGVEAMGVTAEGFFSPPSNAPPVPSRRGNGLS